MYKGFTLQQLRTAQMFKMAELAEINNEIRTKENMALYAQKYQDKQPPLDEGEFKEYIIELKKFDKIGAIKAWRTRYITGLKEAMHAVEAL